MDMRASWRQRLLQVVAPDLRVSQAMTPWLGSAEEGSSGGEGRASNG